MRIKYVELRFFYIIYMFFSHVFPICSICVFSHVYPMCFSQRIAHVIVPRITHVFLPMHYPRVFANALPMCFFPRITHVFLSTYFPCTFSTHNTLVNEFHTYLSNINCSHQIFILCGTSTREICNNT